MVIQQEQAAVVIDHKVLSAITNKGLPLFCNSPLELPFSSEVFQNGFDDFLRRFGSKGVDAGLDFVAAAGKTLFERNII